MRTYRILSVEGVEIASTHALTLLEAIAKHPIASIPVGAQVVGMDGGGVLARCELWAGSCRGWSLAIGQKFVP